MAAKNKRHQLDSYTVGSNGSLEISGQGRSAKLSKLLEKKRGEASCELSLAPG